MAREIESKFYIQDRSRIIQRIQETGARLVRPRTHELNLRFDSTDGELTKGGRVLRLRRDQDIRLTYKEEGEFQGGTLDRREIEFSVSDFDLAREFLEALNFQVSLIYEKFRTTYELDGLELMFDEMPYGDFLEIEGMANRIQPVATTLKLNWEASIPASYSMLFDRLKSNRGLTFRDLTFENFRGLRLTPIDLGVTPADR